MENIKKAIESPLKELGFTVDKITYENKILSIVLDSTDLVDIDRITKATKVISPIIDKNDYIKETYTLDVSSKEKELR